MEAERGEAKKAGGQEVRARGVLSEEVEWPDTCQRTRSPPAHLVPPAQKLTGASEPRQIAARRVTQRSGVFHASRRRHSSAACVRVCVCVDAATPLMDGTQLEEAPVSLAHVC